MVCVVVLLLDDLLINCIDCYRNSTQCNRVVERKCDFETDVLRGITPHSVSLCDHDDILHILGAHLYI